MPPESTPPFVSSLPPELLDGLDDRGRYLYQSVDRITQAQAWLIERSKEHTETLAAVRLQVEKTNGRTTASEAKILALESDPGLKLARVGATLVRSKWFWGAAASAIIVTISVVGGYGAVAPLQAIVKLVFGL
jgi:hypothetical protein